MAKKKILKKSKESVDLSKMSFSDLYAVYLFVSGLNNNVFGKKVQAKDLFRNKLTEVENELYNRVFGVNPFSLKENETVDVIDIKGQNPIAVINSFNKTEVVETTGNFVVAKNK